MLYQGETALDPIENVTRMAVGHFILMESFHSTSKMPVLDTVS